MIPALRCRLDLTAMGLRRANRWRLLVRAGVVGGETDGALTWAEYKRLAFVRWEVEHGQRTEWPLDDATAERIRVAIMERIRDA